MTKSPSLHRLARQAQDAGRFAEAERLYNEAVVQASDRPDIHHDHGSFYALIGRLPEAEAALRRALELAADSPLTQHALAIVLLRQGRYAEAWPLYDARHRVPELGLPKPELPYPEWRGERLTGKRVLIFGEQGFGDQIMFARYARELATQGADVTLFCAEPLQRLFQSLGVRALAMTGPVEFPDPDYWVMSGSVAGRAGATPGNLPSRPYLGEAVARTGGGIGVVTRGNPRHANDANRSLPPELGQRLLALPGAVSLELADTGASDFQHTAGLISGLDLVVTVDTAVAHLAGAMGKPVWILLPALMTDWRWMMGRDDSPWYPTARLFRQAEPGDWEPVLSRIQQLWPQGGVPRAREPSTTEAKPPLDEVQRRKTVIAAGGTDLDRWSRPENLEAAWNARAKAASEMIPRGATVLDLGCGAMHLEKVLPSGCDYRPCDLVARDERTIVCDFNAGECPSIDYDIATALGVLEYLYRPADFLAWLADRQRPAIVSYCPSDLGAAVDRRALGWVNDFTSAELLRMVEAAGFRAAPVQQIGERQLLLKLTPRLSAPPDEKTVWVMSFNQIDNFGDRLGVHLLNRILPPNARVRHVHHQPWDAPPEGEIDLLVLGIGNSLFGSILSDELLAVLDRAKAKVGVFGTQYRELIDASRMGAVIDRLDAWYARSLEDMLLYGKGRTNVRHMGDWLIDAFALTRPSLDETVDLGLAPPPDPALDRTIQYIQSYRRVFSPRLHPLLCALTSADEVAFQEQRPDGRFASGKFRSLLLDVFGAERPEHRFWPVDRQAVAAYKFQVAQNIEAARGEIARML